MSSSDFISPLDRARTLADSYTERLRDIRNDQRLSDDGRRGEIARLYVDHREAKRQLREEHEAALRRQRADLQSNAFGLHSTSDRHADIAEQASYRDALDRAERVGKPDEAITLMDRSKITGDHLLAKALVTVAAQRRWDGAVNHYRQEFGGVAVDRLIDHIQMETDPTRRVGDSMAFSTPTPHELRGLGSGAIQQAAAAVEVA